MRRVVVWWCAWVVVRRSWAAGEDPKVGKATRNAFGRTFDGSDASARADRLKARGKRQASRGASGRLRDRGHVSKEGQAPLPPAQDLSWLSGHAPYVRMSEADAEACGDACRKALRNDFECELKKRPLDMPECDASTSNALWASLLSKVAAPTVECAGPHGGVKCYDVNGDRPGSLSLSLSRAARFGLAAEWVSPRGRDRSVRVASRGGARWKEGRASAREGVPKGGSFLGRRPSSSTSPRL